MYKLLRLKNDLRQLKEGCWFYRKSESRMFVPDFYFLTKGGLDYTYVMLEEFKIYV
jgi:hypothetical protein